MLRAVPSVLALLGLATMSCRPDLYGLGDGSFTAGESSTDPTPGTSDDGLTSRGATFGGGGTTEEPTTGPADSGSGTEASGSTTGGAMPLDCRPQPDLVACYDFAGLGGGTLSDLSGNGNDGLVVGVGVVPGPFGEAATFDAESQIAVPDSASLDVAGSLTVETWIRVDALPGRGRVGVMDNDGQYSMTIHSGDEYRCGFAGVDFFVGPVVVGEWSHFACVLDDAADELHLYVDGMLVGSTEATNPLFLDNSEYMSIGDTSPAFDEPLSGAVGGMRVWSTVRTAEQLCEAAGERCPS